MSELVTEPSPLQVDGLQAVLWDMDGTLVDTEPYWIAAEYRLVESFGGTWSDEHAHALVGSALTASAAYIAEHGGVPLPPEEIIDRLVTEVIEGVRVETVWRPGAVELLAELREAGVPTALVTMSYRRLAEAVAEQLPPGTFRVLVTGDELQHGKPHPEAYLTAARVLGAEPGQCVAIEDSIPGLASAQAAGCVVLAVPNQVPVPESPGYTIVPTLADTTVGSLADLLAQRS